MIKLVAFDLAGTIGDTIPMCLKALKKAVTPYVTHNPLPFPDMGPVQNPGKGERG